METICVDIGNSGLRCVRLRGGASPDRNSQCMPAVTPWNGDVLRIDWPPLGASRHRGSEVEASSAEVAILDALERWLAGTGASPASAGTGSRWFVSSVQRATESHLRACVARLGASAYHLVTRSDLDLQVDVDFPDRVGIDRLLAALAAVELSAARPLIIIQAGSAITVDWVENPRRFCGGAIMPGVPMMLRLLSQAADLLPEVAADELLDLPPLPGRNTAAAMSAGVSSSVVGGVQHLVARYRAQFGPGTPIVLSGGDGPRLAPHLSAPLTTVDHLVLCGLAAHALAQ